MMNIITVEFAEMDAYRLMWLAQREASKGRIWDEYWAGIARHIKENINVDTEVLSQIDYQETLAANVRERVTG